MTLNAIVKILGITYNGKDIDIASLGNLKEATSSQLTYCESEKFLDDLKTTQAGVVLVSDTLKSYVPSRSIALITPNPHLSMAYVSALFSHKPFDTSEQAVIDTSVEIGTHVIIGSRTQIKKNTRIMHNVTIGADVSIGENVIIYPNVVIYDDTVIEDNCIIHAGCIIGSDGFGYAHTTKGEHIKIHHLGNVILEKDVEVGANASIDRSVFGSTIIKQGAKLDNLVHIGHNCIVGQHSLLAAQTGLSGSTILGRNVVMGGQSASAGHLEIGDFAMIAGRGGVSKSIEGGKTYGGFPLTLQSEWLKTQAKISRFFKKN